MSVAEQRTGIAWHGRWVGWGGAGAGDSPRDGRETNHVSDSAGTFELNLFIDRILHVPFSKVGENSNLKCPSPILEDGVKRRAAKRV